MAVVNQRLARELRHATLAFAGGPVTNKLKPRIFASGVYGSDYDVWGAWCFTDKGTRDRLSREIGPDDYCLAIGMTGEDTPEYERGRLLSLIKIGPELVSTPDLVHRDKWRESLDRYGERWMYGFPIRSVERFVDRPLRSEVLPRIARQNLYRTVGRHFVELMPEEVARVLSLLRENDTNIYSTPVSAFASRLLKNRRGPAPIKGTRVLSTKSGPAATYRLKLAGHAAAQAVEPLGLPQDMMVWKIGFSTNPESRLQQINAYMPCEEGLCWKLVEAQWHEDEINAWAMSSGYSICSNDKMVRPLKVKSSVRRQTSSVRYGRKPDERRSGRASR